ncbi:alginate lyase family protein [Methanobacterium oryzae]|uniref:alginate lyase family protein n=1 Tax=Methanobacterium oryzae TaxID=69540 RepID=UPI003D241CA0
MDIGPPEFHFEFKNKEKLIEKMGNHPELIDICLKDADKICQHIFNFLGSEEKNLGADIDWHRDFKTGYKWIPDKYYLGSMDYIDYFKRDEFADVKVPWELSRFQHLVTLGKAFWYTEEEKYAEEFVKQIRSWIKNNPVELGVNWTCTMDVAIRAINWIWGYYFFFNSNVLSDDFKIEFFKSLYLHGRHIMNNLEFAEVRGNHYLSNIAGLIYIGFFLKNSDEAKQWIKKGIASLMEEMDYQVLPDGVNGELSTNYHRLVTEIFVSTTILCLKHNIVFPQHYLNRLEKMFDYILFYTKPDGKAPVIGDNDDGRLQILTKYYDWDRNDHRYLLLIGAKLFRRKDFAMIDPHFNEEAFWMLGSIEKPLLKRDEKELKYNNSISFNDSGYYIIRHNDFHMIIDASSPNPKYFQGHKHNSALNFELFANDKTFIVDPGSCIYTPSKKMRNLFRSTAYHNVIMVDGKEQNTIKDDLIDDLFDLGIDAKTKVIKWELNENEDIFCGEQYGYSRLKNPVVHRREIKFNKKKEYWIINDFLSGKGKHLYNLFLHLAPMKLEPYKIPHSYITKNKETNIAIIPMEIEDLDSQISEGWVSYVYGKKTRAPILNYTKTHEGPTVFSNLIIPFKEKEELEKALEDFSIYLIE